MGNRIVMIEDDAAIAQAVRLNLECADYSVTIFDNGMTAWQALETSHDYDLALLDMMLPGKDGFALLPKLQEYGIPVICLTAMTDPRHEVQGLRGGAEDYIAKPFGMAELMARVRARLRRVKAPDDGIIIAGGLTLDKRAHAVTVNGQSVALAFKEYELLRLLMENRGIAFSREQLLEKIWDYGYDGGSRTVDVHVQTLRAKLGPCGGMIETVRGLGYRFGGK